MTLKTVTKMYSFHTLLAVGCAGKNFCYILLAHKEQNSLLYTVHRIALCDHESCAGTRGMGCSYYNTIWGVEWI